MAFYSHYRNVGTLKHRPGRPCPPTGFALHPDAVKADGIAFPAGENRAGDQLWRLVLGKDELPGRFVMTDGVFVPFEAAKPRIEKIVTGGQTGADQGALVAARAAGIPTGGWAPKGWATEDGPAPWLADLGLSECSKPGYKARTWANARDSDGTVWFGRIGTPGYVATTTAALSLGKPWLVVSAGITRPSDVAEWVASNDVRVLNVAGNRESLDPGIGDRVGAFLIRLFRRLG